MSADGLGAIARLAYKYRLIRDLREARARGEPAPEAAVFKALAREMPGALRELDVLPMEIVIARIEALDRVLAMGAEGEPEPWMRWVSDYHAIFREALRIKAISGKRGIDDAAAPALAERASREAGAPIDEAFVRAIASPPDGRLQPVVLAYVASIHRVSPSTIARTIFTKSR